MFDDEILKRLTNSDFYRDDVKKFSDDVFEAVHSSKFLNYSRRHLTQFTYSSSLRNEEFASLDCQVNYLLNGFPRIKDSIKYPLIKPKNLFFIDIYQDEKYIFQHPTTKRWVLLNDWYYPYDHDSSEELYEGLITLYEEDTLYNLVNNHLSEYDKNMLDLKA